MGPVSREGRELGLKSWQQRTKKPTSCSHRVTAAGRPRLGLASEAKTHSRSQASSDGCLIKTTCRRSDFIPSPLLQPFHPHALRLCQRNVYNADVYETQQLTNWLTLVCTLGQHGQDVAQLKVSRVLEYFYYYVLTPLVIESHFSGDIWGLCFFSSTLNLVFF